MNPEERQLLERTLKVSEENNIILLQMRRSARFATLWEVIKIAFLIIPFIIGYLYLEPYLGSLSGSFSQARDLLNAYK